MTLIKFLRDFFVTKSQICVRNHRLIQKKETKLTDRGAEILPIHSQNIATAETWSINTFWNVPLAIGTGLTQPTTGT